MDRKIESTAILKCKADRIEEFKLAIVELVSKTEKEPGCEYFKIFQSDEDPEEFILWEIFNNQEALDIQIESEHTKKCFALGLFELVSIIHQTEVKK